jgi:DNA polymerase-3 subunit beta
VAGLVEVVKRVALVADRNTPVRLSFSEDGMVVEAGGTEDARASEAMECGYEGDAMQVAFNPTYLLEGLHAMDGPIGVLSLTDPRKPAVLAPAGEDGEIIEGYRYLIMPIRIGA